MVTRIPIRGFLHRTRLGGARSECGQICSIPENSLLTLRAKPNRLTFLFEMRLWPVLIFCSCVCLEGQEIPFRVDLLSEDFKTRKAAEEKVLGWLAEEDGKKETKRFDQLLSTFCETTDPEEVFILRELLCEAEQKIPTKSFPRRGQGFIGISMGPVQFRQQLPQAPIELPKGVLVMGVIEGTPADKAGLQVGDVIHEVAGQSLVDAPSPPDLLKEVISNIVPEEEILVKFTRRGENKEVKLLLMAREAVDNATGVVDLQKQADLKRQDYLRWLNQQRIQQTNSELEAVPQLN